MDRLLEHLISIPSVSGHRKPSQQIIDYCANYLRSRGMYVRKYVDNNFPSLVATTRKTKKPTLMLAAHLDVVPAAESLFTLRLEDGIYYGRGVWDMKSSASAYMHIVDKLQANLADYDFGIMLTSDEEPYGNYGTGMLVEKGYMPLVAILPDAIEPWHLQTFSKGCWFAEISTTGKAAHGSRPWEGDSASFKLIRALQRITKLFEHRQLRETATLNIGIIRSGEQVNQIPNSAMATIDIRYVEEADMAEIVAAISDICSAEGAIVTTTREDDGPVDIDIHNPYIATFASTMAEFLGEQPKTISMCGTSDARFFTKKGVPVVLTSPIGGGYHGDAEWLDAADYERFQQLLLRYIEKIAKPPQPAVNKALTVTA